MTKAQVGLWVAMGLLAPAAASAEIVEALPAEELPPEPPGTCISVGGSCGPGICAEGYFCSSGTCVSMGDACGSSEECGGGTCYELAGACGDGCADGFTCQLNQCVREVFPPPPGGCVGGPDVCPPGPPPCSPEGQCFEGATCIEGYCLFAPVPSCGEGMECPTEVPTDGGGEEPPADDGAMDDGADGPGVRDDSATEDGAGGDGSGDDGAGEDGAGDEAEGEAEQSADDLEDMKPEVKVCSISSTAPRGEAWGALGVFSALSVWAARRRRQR